MGWIDGWVELGVDGGPLDGCASIRYISESGRTLVLLQRKHCMLREEMQPKRNTTDAHLHATDAHLHERLRSSSLIGLE